MEVWKGQIKSPRGLITRIDMKNRSAKVLVEGGRPAATLLRTPLATNGTTSELRMATTPGQERILTPSTFDGRCPNCLHVLT